MKTPLLQRKWSPGKLVHLLVVSAMFLPWGRSTISAAPRPLSPPWPEFGLIHREGFDQPYGFPTNQTVDSAVWTESWTGWSLNRQGKRVAPWAVPMVVSNAFRVEPERGAIRLWYRPDFNSGAGPGSTATLLEMVSASGKTEAVWWALVVSPAGNEIHLVCQKDSGLSSCLSTKVEWAAGTWHLLTLGFTPTNSAFFVDDQLSAIGEGLEIIPKEVSSFTGLIVGSDASGNLPAQGQIEELSIFSGRKKMQQIMGNNFGLSLDWEIGIYYASLSKTAALGPISDEEIAARKALAEKRKAERAALGLGDEGGGGGPQMLRLVGGTSICITNSPLYITNTVCVYNTNSGWTLQFDVQGTNALGTTGGPVDIFSTTNLAGTNWLFLERGPSCSTYQYTNQFPAGAFYILGDATVDPDGDGLSTAYERLVSHSNPLVFDLLDTDGDGFTDAWEVANGLNPLLDDSGQFSSRLNYIYDGAGWLDTISGAQNGIVSLDAEGNVLQVSH